MLIGSGSYGSAFRVCKDKIGCKQCIVLKTGDIEADEIRATKAVTDVMAGVSPHFVKFKGGVVNKGKSFLFLEYAPPIVPANPGRSGVGTFQGVLSRGNDFGIGSDMIRQMIFQTCYSLIALTPVARHNDIKAANIAVCPWDMKSSVTYQASPDLRFRLKNPKVNVRIVDFGLLDGPTQAFQNDDIMDSWSDYCSKGAGQRQDQLI